MKLFRNPVLFVCALLTATLFTMSACRKSAEEVIALITESEAAEIIETAVAQRSAGLTMPTIDMAALVDQYLENCGTPGDTTILKSKNGGATTYNYTFNMNWLVNCNALGIPLDANTTVTGNGSFNSLHWNGSDATSGSLVFTGLNPSEPNYIANGSYSLQGDITGSLRRNTPTFNCKTDITVKDLTIRKSDYTITGGTGTAVVTANNGQGETTSLTSSLTFNGDGTVTVVINGQTHTFQLQ
jgi:hypothetical protein